MPSSPFPTHIHNKSSVARCTADPPARRVRTTATVIVVILSALLVAMQGSIHVAKRCEHHPVTAALLKQKNHLELDPDGRTPFDYRGLSVCFLVEPYTALADMQSRVRVKDRLLGAKTALGGRQLVLLVIMTTVDPSQDVLNWINIDCGIELQVAAVLCWSHEEGAIVVQHSRTSSAMSLDYAGGVPKKEEAPLPTLIDAFTQSPQVLTRPDVVRLCHRHRCVADFLSASPESFEGVPGMGKRKVDRLDSLLNTPFAASTEKVSDVLHGARAQADGSRGRSGTVAANIATTTEEGQAAMEAALRRRIQEEEQEDAD